MRSLKAMSGGGYVPGSTVVHRIDPRAKIILTVMFAVGALMAPLFGWLFFLLVTAFAVGRVAGVRVGSLLGRARPLLSILIITLLIHGIQTTQPVSGAYWPLGSLFLSMDGLAAGAFFAGRLLVIIVGTSLLGMTTASMDIVDGLSALLSPLRRLKLNVDGFAMTLGLALRFVPTVVGEGDRIARAQMARGSDVGRGGIGKRAKAVTSIVVPLFVGSLRRARGLALALEAKGYGRGSPRTRMVPMVWRFSDTLVLSVFTLVFGSAALHALILI